MTDCASSIARDAHEVVALRMYLLVVMMTTRATIFTAVTVWQLGGCMVGDGTVLEDDNPVEPERFVPTTEPIPGRYIVVIEPPKSAFAAGQFDMVAAVD